MSKCVPRWLEKSVTDKLCPPGGCDTKRVVATAAREIDRWSRQGNGAVVRSSSPIHRLRRAEW